MRDRRNFIKRTSVLTAGFLFPAYRNSFNLISRSISTSDNPKNILYENLDSPVKVSFRMKNYIIWGGSAVKAENGKFYMFASRWPKKLTMGAWVTNSEIVLAEADNPEGPYHFKQVVLPVRGSEYWDGMMTHNPNIHYHKGKYLLFYIGGTYDFQRPKNSPPSRKLYEKVWNTKRIGIAVSNSVFGPWERMDSPILYPRENYWDAAIISNPAPIIYNDGSVFLIYKSAPYKYPERTMGEDMYLGAATASNYLGPYERVGENNKINIENVTADIEDPNIWYDGKHYQMVVKCMDESITGEKGTGFFAYSKDGLNWKLPNNPKIYSMTVNWFDGSMIKMKRMERPQVFLQNGKPTHIFFACIDPVGDIYNIVKPLTS